VNQSSKRTPRIDQSGRECPTGVTVLLDIGSRFAQIVAQKKFAARSNGMGSRFYSAVSCSAIWVAAALSPAAASPALRHRASPTAALAESTSPLYRQRLPLNSSSSASLSVVQ
jgi:hypothetical protein